MVAGPLKVLVAGNIDGNLDALFARVSRVHKSKAGPFDMLICSGTFFPSPSENESFLQPYIDGTKEVPLSTYFACSFTTLNQFSKDPPEKGPIQLCNNLTWLGHEGTTNVRGLKLSFCTTLVGSNAQHDNLGLFAGPCSDILISNEWPRGVCKTLAPHLYPVLVPGQAAMSADNRVAVSASGARPVADVALSARPRYHFSGGGGGLYYERPPYINLKEFGESTSHVTRFISLAKVANPDKAKWLYATNITPASSLETSVLNQQPSVTTSCPFAVGAEDVSVVPSSPPNKRRRTTPGSNATSSFAGRGRGDGGRGRGGGGGGIVGGLLPLPGPPGAGRGALPPHAQPHQQNRPADPRNASCWFCLASPKVEKHLIVSVGDESYVALAKGGLVPEHALIVPISHHVSIVRSPTELNAEVQTYKECLRKMFASQGKATVMYERCTPSRFGDPHAHIQICPIPEGAVDRVRSCFEEVGKRYNIEFEELNEGETVKEKLGRSPWYFVLNLPSGKTLLHEVQGPFPMNYGREALAQLLGMPERTDWKRCQVTEEEEKTAATSFRDAFKPHDTLI